MKTFYFIAFLHYLKRAVTIFYNDATRIQFPESEFLAKKVACNSSGQDLEFVISVKHSRNYLLKKIILQLLAKSAIRLYNRKSQRLTTITFPAFLCSLLITPTLLFGSPSIQYWLCAFYFCKLIQPGPGISCRMQQLLDLTTIPHRMFRNKSCFMIYGKNQPGLMISVTSLPLNKPFKN